ncbi:hypothetical protein BDV35DRAFT_354285 [Aspergillus flavus]|uniref:Uncharacterized protein n=1 Tax=Aspergillus flavus TaxID=5059 RepID=A0A5N6GZ48_ASPFL|nr:hypothetical protein BDV35DRAFT_354285 [Aspergillus flavus]
MERSSELSFKLHSSRGLRGYQLLVICRSSRDRRLIQCTLLRDGDWGWRYSGVFMYSDFVCMYVCMYSVLCLLLFRLL